MIKSSKIDLNIPWTATLVDGVMTSEYTGTGVEEGYDFTLEGTFSVRRTS